MCMLWLVVLRDAVRVEIEVPLMLSKEGEEGGGRRGNNTRIHQKQAFNNVRIFVFVVEIWLSRRVTQINPARELSTYCPPQASIQ